MATAPPKSVAVPFARLQHPDPETNRIIQDLYDKLAQAYSAITTLQNTKLNS